jgi:hypothetical protein
MDFKVGVMTHAIPNALGVAFPAVIVITINQPVFINNGILKTHPGFTVRANDILNLFS